MIWSSVVAFGSVMPPRSRREAVAVVPRQATPGVRARAYAGYAPALTPRAAVLPYGRNMADRQAVAWTDLALTAVLLFIGLNGTGPAAANQGQTVPVAGYVLVVAACLPIVVWRWRPLWALVGTGAAVAAYLALGYAYGPVMFPLIVAVYGYAARAALRRTVVATTILVGAAVAALAAEVAVGDRGAVEFLTGIAWTVAWLIIPAAVGVVVKVRQDAAAQVRAEQARRGISEERLGLAQEVHDVVGHSLAVIAMQAGVALRALEQDPGQAREVVESIRTTSTEALASLRAELDTLRQASPEPDAPRRPRTGVARSEERRVGKGCTSRASTDNTKNELMCLLKIELP